MTIHIKIVSTTTIGTTIVDAAVTMEINPCIIFTGA